MHKDVSMASSREVSRISIIIIVTHLSRWKNVIKILEYARANNLFSSHRRKNVHVIGRRREKKNARKHLMTHLQYVIVKRVDSIMFDFSCALDYTRHISELSLSLSTALHHAVLPSVTNLLWYIFCRLRLQATNSKRSECQPPSSNFPPFIRLFTYAQTAMGNVIVNWFGAVSIAVW